MSYWNLLYLYPITGWIAMWYTANADTRRMRRHNARVGYQMYSTSEMAIKKKHVLFGFVMGFIPVIPLVFAFTACIVQENFSWLGRWMNEPWRKPAPPKPMPVVVLKSRTLRADEAPI